MGCCGLKMPHNRERAGKPRSGLRRCDASRMATSCWSGRTALTTCAGTPKLSPRPCVIGCVLSTTVMVWVVRGKYPDFG